MKYYNRIFLASFLAVGLSSSTLKAQEITLTELWKSDKEIKTPESVLLEPKENVLYVSCINGNPNTENQESFISKLSPDGKLLMLKLTEGLNATKGMGILNNRLYVTEMSNIVEIDHSSGKVLARYSVEAAKFLNDIAVDIKQGTLYISDSGTNRLLALANGKITVISEDSQLKGINGLLIEDGNLLIGNGEGKLLSMNLSSKKLITISQGMGGIDGIVALGDKKYIVSEWSGKIWSVIDGRPKLLIDSSGKKINTADMEYNPKTKTLYVPNFYSNMVTAYLVKIDR